MKRMIWTAVAALAILSPVYAQQQDSPQQNPPKQSDTMKHNYTMKRDNAMKHDSMQQKPQ